LVRFSLWSSEAQRKRRSRKSDVKDCHLNRSLSGFLVALGVWL